MTAVDKLKPKHKLFLYKYLETLNGTQSYISVYGSTNYDVAKSGAHKLLSRDDIKAALNELATNDVDRDILVLRMRQLLEFDLTELLDERFQVDLNKIRTSGLGWVVTAIKPTGEVVLIDKNKVLDMLARVYRLYEESVITVNLDGKLTIEDQLNSKLDALASVLNESA
jgi:hypothetical protein